MVELSNCDLCQLLRTTLYTGHLGVKEAAQWYDRPLRIRNLHHFRALTRAERGPRARPVPQRRVPEEYRYELRY